MEIGREKIESLRGKEAEKWMNDLWEEVIDKLAETSVKAEIRKILDSLISNYEKKIVLKRLGVIALVRMGKSYQEISQILWLSPNTISTLKKNIFNNKENYKSYRKFYGGRRKYSVDSKLSDSLSEKSLGGVLWDILNNPPRPPGIGLKRSSGGFKRR